MYDQTKSETTHNVTSSPELASGVSHFDSLGGLTTRPSGPVPVRANLSALQPSRTSAQDLATAATSGHSFTDSPASAALQSCLVNRLQAKMASTGSTAFSLTWSEKVTPAGRPYLAQLARALITSGSGRISFPTPCARDGRDISRSNAFLSQRERHSPSLATHLLVRGAPWQVITQVYALAMNLPSQWNGCAPKGTETLSTRARRVSSSKA